MNETGTNWLPRTQALTFLRECGLLAEINRRVLHPLGLALAVEIENGIVHDMGLLTCNDEEGFLYAQEDLEEAAQKLTRFLPEAKTQIARRQAVLGFVEQSLPESCR